jgi:regulator of protease activity HflC (stomatin/prohibitin superfamily)
MTIGFILGVILLIACGACAFFGVLYFKKRQTKKGVLYAIIGGIVCVMFILFPFSFQMVETGEIAVVKHLGKAEKVRTAGTYFDFWVTEKYEVYDAKVQNMEIKTQAYSKDAQTMNIVMSVQYQIDSSKIIEIANKYGELDRLADRIQNIATEKTKSKLSSYSAMSIIETRSTISPLIEDIIKATVTDEYCVKIVAVVLTNIDFSAAFEKTVEDKMIAEQEKLKAEYEKQTAIVNAEKELEVAKLAAQAKIESAKADAQAQIEVAKAEAQAIQLKSIEVARALGFKILEETAVDEDGVEMVIYTIDFEGKTAEEIQVITDYMKYLEYLAKWDGKLPSVMAGDSATIMIPLPSTGDAVAP